MKKLLALLIASAFIMPVMAEDVKPEVKKVCIKQKDSKTGKEKEVCKNVKKHKKHEGTEVPTGKKK
jgi:hypothetical protein